MNLLEVIRSNYEVIAIGSLLAGILATIAVVDFREYRVPNELNVLALVLRAIDLIIASHSDLCEQALVVLTRSTTLCAIFLTFRIAYRRLRGREGLGLGDVKLAAVAGAWVDWPFLPFVVQTAAVICFGLIFFRTARSGSLLRLDVKAPFAVGFAPAIWLGWCLQSQVM